MKNILSPSILAADFKVLGEQLNQIADGGAEYVHIDVMDGLFVPSISFGMPVIQSIRSASNLVFDVHLMIDEPVRYIEEFKKAGAEILTVHYEACKDVTATLEAISSFDMKAGLSIKPGTPVSVVEDFLNYCDMILLMSVEPGFGGQKFMENSIERAQKIKSIIDRSGRTIDLEIDGGINTDNVERVLDAGVNVIVAGSAVFKNPYENTKAFMEILKQKEL